MATIEAALDAGLNLLDTGEFYGMGHNESIVGRAIGTRREQAFLSVKFGAMWSPSGEFLGADLRPAAVKNFAAYSLERLAVDEIDLYQPGRLDPTIPVEDTVGAISDLIRDGKVRYLGLSEVSAEQLRQAHRIHPVAALEIEYSLTSRFIEREILPTARELGIPIVAYNVLAPNQLAERADSQQGALLVSMAEAKGCTPAQLAIAWVLSRGADVIPLIGMSRRARLAETLAALDVSLDSRDLTALDLAFPVTERAARGPAGVSRLSPK